jgi:hypothetical protein
MPNAVRFWVDPICPWCWVTARWVRDVAPERDLYVEYGRRIHHDGERLWDPAEALHAVGLGDTHAAAADDASWDDAIRVRMDQGLALVGADVGTPIIAVRTDDGREVALFGPVISRVPATKDALALWDSMTFLAGLDDFWELKRTRTVRPDPGARP